VRDCGVASLSAYTKLASGRYRSQTSETRIGYEPMLAAVYYLHYFL